MTVLSTGAATGTKANAPAIPHMGSSCPGVVSVGSDHMCIERRRAAPSISRHARPSRAHGLNRELALAAFEKSRLVLDQREHRITRVSQLASSHGGEPRVLQERFQRGEVVHPQMSAISIVIVGERKQRARSLSFAQQARSEQLV